MITEDYCGFEIAKLLKEKDFNENCYHVYHSIPNSRNVIRYHRISLVNNSSIDEKEDCVCPTLQMAMKWLREVHHIIIVPHPLSFNVAKDCLCENWVFSLWVGCKLEVDESLKNQPAGYCPTYEKICEAAILYCLQNLI